MTVLVAYATAHGSTREVAERIAARLRASGTATTVATVDAAGGVDGYRTVVVGSAIHDRAWLPSATRFVTANASPLAGRALWLFGVGMPGALPRPLRRLGRSEAHIVFAPFAALHPRGARLFSGVVRREDFPQLSSRIAFRLMGCCYGDFRDWQAIDAWADEIAGDGAAWIQSR